MASPLPPDIQEQRDAHQAWRSVASELGRITGYPNLAVRPGHSVLAGQASWLAFIARASVTDLSSLVDAARASVAPPDTHPL